MVADKGTDMRGHILLSRNMTIEHKICVTISYHCSLSLEDSAPRHFEKDAHLLTAKTKLNIFSDIECLHVFIQTLGIPVRSFWKKIELLFSRKYLGCLCFLVRWLRIPS